MYVNQTIMLYILNFYSDVWQLYKFLFSNKAGKKENVVLTSAGLM